MIRLASASALLWAASLAAAEMPGRLELIVVDSATRTPLSGAAVELQRTSRGPSSIRDATSDQNGRAVFPQVDPGQHRVALLQREGYAYEWSGTTFEVSEGTTTTGIVTMFPLGVIEGTVSDDMDRPVANANVVALKYSYQGGVKTLLPSDSFSKVTTDAQGRYRIDAVKPGLYYVRASSASRMFPAVYYPNVASSSDASRVTVSPSTAHTTADIRVRPAETFHVRGKVSGIPENTPIRLLDIQSCSEGVRESPAFVTASPIQADGGFDVADVPRGRYCLTVRAMSGKENIAYARDVVTVDEKDVEGFELSAGPLLELSGTVTLESGSLLAMPTAVQFTQVETIGSAPITAKVDRATGMFRINVLRAKYSVSVEATRGEYISTIRFAGRQAANGVIDSAAGGMLEIGMAAARGRLHGKVTGAMGRLTVTLVSDGGSTGRAALFRVLTINDIEFTLSNLPPGTYKAYAWETFEPDVVQSPEFLRGFAASTVDVAADRQAEVEVRLISAAEVRAGMERF
jgi:hypothetical protein